MNGRKTLVSNIFQIDSEVQFDNQQLNQASASFHLEQARQELEKKRLSVGIYGLGPPSNQYSDSNPEFAQRGYSRPFTAKLNNLAAKKISRRTSRNRAF